MADIRIEKKESGSSILPWILGLLVAALAIWGITSMLDNEDDIVEEPVENIEEIKERGSAVVESDPNEYTLIDFENDEIGKEFNEYFDEYSTYTVDMKGNMGLDHEFSHNALIMLANSTSALARAQGMGVETNIRAEEAKIRNAANYITKDPYATDHANKIREAAMSIVNVLETVQEAKYPGLEGAVEDVKQAANDISTKELTLDQKEDVRDFFGKAKVLLQGMRDFEFDR